MVPPAPIRSEPAATTVPPVWAAVPVRVNDPAPARVRAPGPEMAPERVSAKPPLSMVPPAAPTLTGRAEASAWLVSRAPPFSVRPPDGAPRLASVEIDSVPPDTVTPPVKVLAAESTRVPRSVLTRPPVPWITAPMSALMPAPAPVPSPTRITVAAVLVLSGWPAMEYPPTANWPPPKLTWPALLSTVTTPGAAWKTAKPSAGQGAFTTPVLSVQASLAGAASQVPAPPSTTPLL